MQFFVGFATATLVFIISLCLYVFFNEENKKRNRRNILPGHEFYVHRIGEIKIKSVIGDQIISTDLLTPHNEKQSEIVSTCVQLSRTQIDLTCSLGRAPPCTYLS